MTRTKIILASTTVLWLLLLLLARLINRQDVVFDEEIKFGSFGCRQRRQVIRPQKGNFHSDTVLWSVANVI